MNCLWGLLLHSMALTVQGQTFICRPRKFKLSVGKPHRHGKELQTERGSNELWFHVVVPLILSLHMAQEESESGAQCCS